jgi:AcrR family transcriptional regulator
MAVGRSARRTAGTRPGGQSTPSSSKTRQRDPGGKTRAILAATTRLFAADGYAATTTGRIAKAAGVSEGLVFLHFGSKRDLLNAVAVDYGHAMVAHILDGFDISGPPDTRRLVTRTFEFVGVHGLLYALVGTTRDPAADNAAFRSAQHVVVSALEHVLRGWRAQGYGEAGDQAIAATMVFGVVHTALVECFLNGQRERERIYVDTTVAWIERALDLPRGPDRG